MSSWEDGVISDPVPATQEQVAAARRELRVPLPEEFLAIAGVRQGARPVPAHFDLPDGSVSSVECLLHFADEPFTSNILAAAFPVQTLLEKGHIPFARDVGGDLLLFDYRADYEHPAVLFWSVDSGPVWLAPDFSSWVASLHDG